MTPILTRLTLDDYYKPEQDIRVYLEDVFQEIKSTHPRKDFVPKSWPSPDQVEKLVYRASGQFIYAATVVKYVQSLQHSPVDRLEVILGLRPLHNDRPFAELDALYTEIFLALDELRPVLQILRLGTASSCAQSFFSTCLLSVNASATFLFLKPSDVCGYMSNISALVTLNTDIFGDTYISISHKSLIEFLDDPSRAGTLYLGPGLSHAQILHRYLQIIQDENEFIVACDMWRLLETIAPNGLLEHCRSAPMTEELREDLIQLSVPKFIDFFLRRPVDGGLDAACEVLELLRNLSQNEVDIPDHRPALRKHMLTLLEPYFSHPRLTSLWILAVDPWGMSWCSSHKYTLRGPVLDELLQLDQSLCEMDKTRFWFTWNTSGHAESNCKHIKSTLPSAVTVSRGTILATLALHLLEYLCNQSFPQITRLRKTDYDSGVIRNAPWMWRQRFVAIRPSRPKLDKDDAKAGFPIELCVNSILPYRPGMVEQWQSLSNLIYALDRLPTLLKHATEDDALITFATRRTIFPQQAFHFPRSRKRAQNAVNAYLARFPTHPPAIPLSDHFGEGPDKRCGHWLGSPWDGIFVLFPYLLAFLVYICFLWITYFA